MTTESGKIILLLWMVSLAQPLSGQTPLELRAEIDKIIRHDTEISLDQIPGFIIGILDGDSTSILPYGVRIPGSDQVLSEQDVFELGSLTKVLTAEILFTLHEGKLLNIHDPLNNYLHPEYRNPLIRSSLLDVLMHQSGIAKIPETLGQEQHAVDDPYAHFSDLDLLNWYKDHVPGPRGEFRYSHAGYAVLEFVIKNVTQRSYEYNLDKFVAHGGCITADTNVALTPGTDLARRETGPWTFPSFISSEGAKGCLEGLLSYVKVLLDQPDDLAIWDTFRPTGEKRLMIAPGWYRFLPKKHFPVYVHTGRTSGHSSMVAFARKTNTAVVILANSSVGTDDLGLLILRMINKQWRRKS